MEVLMKILVAMDDSDFARHALNEAIKLAKYESSELVIMTVIPHMGIIDELPLNFVEKLKKAGEKILKEASKKAEEGGIKTTEILEEGVAPADNIITCAEEYQVKLIVMGHRGMNAKMERFFLGSVAFRVISHAPCSVMVVK
jgi:nucleotide-binding universal stress UspA family protein